MSETVKDLKDLGAATDAPAAETTKADAPAVKAEKKEPKVDKMGRAYATGRRKESVARVWLKKGSGQVIINGKPQDQYFGRQTHLLVLNQPFLTRALENMEPELRPVLKKAGMLTRDARVVERKKIGKHKARRSTVGEEIISIISVRALLSFGSCINYTRRLTCLTEQKY